MAEKGKIPRRLMGVRVGFTLGAIGCYFGTLCTLAHYGDAIEQTAAWDALQTLFYVVLASIVGDTARPSGSKQAAFMVQKAPQEQA